MSEDLLKSLETKLERLIEQCDSLRRENRELKSRESDWQRERTRLMEKNELARTRVESMIDRLKSLEAD